MARLGIDQFTAFFGGTKGFHTKTWQLLSCGRKCQSVCLKMMRTGFRLIAIQRLKRILRFRLFLLAKKRELMGGVKAAAKKAGAKFPEVVAAQWALESAWGDHTTGDFNYFGIKAAGGEEYSTCTTWEHYDGKDVTIQAKFRDFDSMYECVDDLVRKCVVRITRGTKVLTDAPVCLANIL